MSQSSARRSTNARRVLVIGATGQVGRELIQELDRRPEPLEVVDASRSHPDPARQVRLERPETIEDLVVAMAPDHVILAAAETNVAWCEEHPEDSWRINVLGAEATAIAAGRVGSSFTFISTDYVFDGIRGPYGEDEATNPLNIYGAHKLAAETAVLAADPTNLVIRTCQVFGLDPRRINFVVRVADQLRREERVEVAGDLFGTPTYAPDLARALVDLTLSGRGDIWHVAGESFLSRYELAKMVAAAFGFEGGRVVEVSADQMDDSVTRPRLAGLRCERLAAASLSVTRPITESLEDLAAMDTGR